MMSNIIIKTKILSDSAIVPINQTSGSAGSDLYYNGSDIIIPTMNTKLLSTGICVEIPEGFVGFICSRSGLSAKHSVFVLNSPGVIDSDYRGEIKIVLHNSGTKDFQVISGMRIAQLLILPMIKAKFITHEQLTNTTRGEQGFGSTGK